MKKIIITATILLNAAFFVSCSNMTVGFEEDSPFYNGPLLDTRDDAKVKEDTQEPEQKGEIVIEKKVDKESENETSFSYIRDEE